MRVSLKALAATLLAAVAFPAAAAAESLRPNQSIAAQALPLLYLPALGSQTAGLCLVDTGVDRNPDTMAVERLAVGGADVSDNDPHKHGTLMAMVAGAPINGWGMVGAWPSARIISMRALGLTYFPRGIDDCTDYRRHHNVKVIEMALGAPGPQPGDDPQLLNAVDRARREGINVVAAAGNDGGPLDAPANYPPVFAVGGVDRGGFFCRYPTGGSASGRELDISALGCGVSVARPSDGLSGQSGGTSEASAFVAAVLSALRTYRPDLTPDGAERILIDTATPIPAGSAYRALANVRANS